MMVECMFVILTCIDIKGDVSLRASLTGLSCETLASVFKTEFCIC